MKKILSILALSFALVGCGGPDITGKYTAEKSSLFMTIKFTLEIMDNGKALIHIPKIGPAKASSGEMKYLYEDNTLSIWEEGKDEQIIMKVEEEGKILRLVSSVKGFPEVWTKSVTQ